MLIQNTCFKVAIILNCHKNTKPLDILQADVDLLCNLASVLYKDHCILDPESKLSFFKHSCEAQSTDTAICFVLFSTCMLNKLLVDATPPEGKIHPFSKMAVTF